MAHPSAVQTYRPEAEGPFPNNPSLPTLVLRGAVSKVEADRAQVLERLFRRHDWQGVWQNGIFSYHHYHSTAHEVLGVAEGAARLRVGGPGGPAVDVEAGDVLILPAGVAHKNLGAESGFLVVGAYPAACPDWDLKRGRPGERPEVDRTIEGVPLPKLGPVYGSEGPLVEAWDLSP